MENVVHISASERIGLAQLLSLIEKYAGKKSKEVELIIPYAESNVVSTIYGSANEVIEEQYREGGIYIKAVLDEISYGRLRGYIMH
jgi:GTP-binding protein HflX